MRQNDFRARSCAHMNNATHQYFPHTSSIQSCNLVCREEKDTSAVNFNMRLRDGTKCHSFHNDRCIGGKCRAVGCDNVLGSKATADKCGVCRGTGASCKDVDGSYSIGHSLPAAYKVAVMPRGARNLVFTKANLARNSLVIRAASDGTVLFDASTIPDTIRGDVHYPFGDMYMRARVTRTKKIFTILGELSEDHEVHLNVTKYKERPSSPGLIWRYTLDGNKFSAPPQTRATQFERVLMVSGCSVTCGTGLVTASERCMRRRDSRLASAGYCHGLPALARASTHIQCNRGACPTNA